MTQGLTREELARGRELLKAAFVGPWRYKQFEIECRRCDSYEQGITETECTNPECNGEDVPATFVEAPAAYPGESDEYRAQVVATIDVPGLSCIAQKNGEAICWLRNNAESLIQASATLDNLLDALVWCSSTGGLHVSAGAFTGRNEALAVLLDYAKRLGWNGGGSV